VGEVLCVGYEKNDCFNEVKTKIPKIERRGRKRIRLMVQKRLGGKRPGKGDGMNTCLDFFVHRTSYDRIHFYDADIVSFGRGWIERGERKVTEKLLKNKRVLNYSDWGIDTAYTLAFCRYQVPLYEVYIKEGKLHKLYGKLTDLYTMLMECFAIIQEECKMKIGKGNIPYKKDPVDRVPKEVREKKAFDVKGTLPLLRENWTEEEMELLALFPHPNKRGNAVLPSRCERPFYGSRCLV